MFADTELVDCFMLSISEFYRVYNKSIFRELVLYVLNLQNELFKI